LRWVPPEQTAAQKAQRVANSRKLLRVLRVEAANGVVNIITGDESWYYWSYDHSSQWNTSRDLVPTRRLMTIDSKKLLFIVIFSGYGLLALGDLPKGLKMNSQYFWDAVLEEVGGVVTAITKES
jgi:hypothetical protein